MGETTNELFKVTEIELAYRSKISASEGPKITNTSTANEILRHSWDGNKIELLEQFKILLLNRRSACLGVSVISSGGVAGTVADPKIIFATALKACASGIILAHNHPSGNLSPSEADIALTAKMVNAGRFLDIQVTDHIILTRDKYYSFADEGMMP